MYVWDILHLAYRILARVRVSPAGGHGADDAAARVHVQIPPGQNYLSSTAGLHHKPARVWMRSAADRPAEVHTNTQTQTWFHPCVQNIICRPYICDSLWQNIANKILVKCRQKERKWGESVYVRERMRIPSWSSKRIWRKQCTSCDTLHEILCRKEGVKLKRCEEGLRHL